MKKYIVYSLLTLIVLTSPLNAQEIKVRNEQKQEPTELSTQEQQNLFEDDSPAVINDSKQLDVEFIQPTQNPGNKNAKFIMRVTSGITTDRIQFSWNIKGNSTVLNQAELKGTRTFEKGKTYDISITIRPIGSGVTEVYGEIEAFGAASDVIATVRKNFASNANGEILPITSAYSNAKIMYTVQSIGLVIAIVVGLAILGTLGLRQFTKWYKKDEQAEFDRKVQTAMTHTEG